MWHLMPRRASRLRSLGLAFGFGEALAFALAFGAALAFALAFGAALGFARGAINDWVAKKIMGNVLLES